VFSPKWSKIEQNIFKAESCKAADRLDYMIAWTVMRVKNIISEGWHFHEIINTTRLRFSFWRE
jgi:hypothetical protein